MHEILLVTDIFGDSPQLRETLSTIGLKATIISPYSEYRIFADESQAYQAFLAAGGLDAYYHNLLQALKLHRADSLKLMIGFSAGAAALWRFICSEHATSTDKECQAWLYYGGQIRDELSLQPQLNTVIRWSLETQFDVWQCHHAMQNKALVDSAVLPYQHGFINPQSKGFIAHAAADFWMTLEAYAHNKLRVLVA